MKMTVYPVSRKAPTTLYDLVSIIDQSAYSSLDANNKWFADFGKPYNYYIDENDNNIMEIALAGFNKSDISVIVEGGKLKIEVEAPKVTDENRKYFHHGISKRSMKVTFSLLDTVDKKKITTEFKDGMLKIVLPRLEEDKFVLDIK
jgi:HSP20 family molecular chaperone IbpA